MQDHPLWWVTNASRSLWLCKPRGPVSRDPTIFTIEICIGVLFCAQACRLPVSPVDYPQRLPSMGRLAGQGGVGLGLQIRQAAGAMTMSPWGRTGACAHM
jgi:hypothetical protein